MGSIGMPELIVIFVVILMLFGSKKLPELARGLGQGMREFKRATNEFKSELEMQGIRKEFDEQIKGNIDEIKNDLDKTINAVPWKVDAKSPGTSQKGKNVAVKLSDTPKQKNKVKAKSAAKKENKKKSK